MVERDWRVSQAKMAAQIRTFQLTACQNPTRDMGKGVTGLGDKERKTAVLGAGKPADQW